MSLLLQTVERSETHRSRIDGAVVWDQAKGIYRTPSGRRPDALGSTDGFVLALMNQKYLMKCCKEFLLPGGHQVTFCAYNTLGYREQARE